LIEVAIQQLHEYAWVGFGGTPPDHWGALIDGRKHVDIVNNYIFIAYSSGVLGFLLICAIQIGAIRRLLKLFHDSTGPVRYYAFSMICLIISIIVTSMSVALFGPTLLLSYITY